MPRLSRQRVVRGTEPRCSKRHRTSTDSWTRAKATVDPSIVGPGATLLLEGTNCRPVANKCYIPSGDAIVTVKSLRQEICRYAGYEKVWTLTFTDALKGRRGNNSNGSSGHGKCIWFDPVVR